MARLFFWGFQIALLALIYAVARISALAGWELCVAFVAGGLYFYVVFRWHYGWFPDFNLDGEDEANRIKPRISGR